MWRCVKVRHLSCYGLPLCGIDVCAPSALAIMMRVPSGLYIACETQEMWSERTASQQNEPYNTDCGLLPATPLVLAGWSR